MNVIINYKNGGCAIVDFSEFTILIFLMLMYILIIYYKKIIL